MKKIIAMLLCVITAFSVLAGCSDKGEDTGDIRTTEDVPIIASDDTEQTVDTFVIQTQYAELHYPAQWKNDVNVEVTNDIVQFSCGDIRLFDLTFSGNSGYVLGTLATDKGNVVLSITNYDINNEAKYYDKYCAMQEDVNVIIEHLMADYDFTIGEPPVEEDTSVFEIETDLTTLYYPKKWQDAVTVETNQDVAKFSCGETPLFDLIFTGEEGYLLGTYNGTEIRIIAYDLEEANLSDTEYSKLCAMQDDVNVLLQYLMADSDFLINPS